MSSVLIFSEFYLPGFKGGGPIRTISNMVEAIGDAVKCKIISRDRDLGAKSAYSSVNLNGWNSQGKAEVLYVPRGISGITKIIYALKNEQYDTVSLNSFFSFQFSIFPLLLCRIFQHRVPILVGPRGEFSSGALEMKSSKKRFFLLVFRFFRLHRNVIWHASSDYEAVDIRRVMGADVCIRIAIDIAEPGDGVPFAPRVQKEALRIVFLSRISPKKNLLGAIEMLRNVTTDVAFDVYGPVEDADYWEKCRIAAELLPKNVKFRQNGAMQPKEVVACLAKYDLFFFPTLGENFGHVIAEALAAGLPLLISNTTPWRGLSEKSIGWDIPLERPEEFVANIERCCEKSPEEYADWRKKIRAWAVENIGGKEAIEQNRKLFLNLE